MLACVDVDYRASRVVAAGVVFEAWGSESATAEQVLVSDAAPAPYEPGAFYKRELPFVLPVLEGLDVASGVVIVDGYAWLGDGAPGLGAHLYEALGRRAAVVGVAKRPFRGSTWAVPVLRGTSERPLFVTAVGMDVAEAARGVRAMHGPHRVPTLLRRVDRLARDG